MTKLISWNVNGLRACMGKGFADFFEDSDADIFCLQETKLQAGQLDFAPKGYTCLWNYAEKKGYSGTAVFLKAAPLSVAYGMEPFMPDAEGRLITVETDGFFLICQYTPNAQEGLKRLSYRMDWEDAFRAYIAHLQKTKPVVICGDLNVAHNEIDLKNPAANRGNPGFSDEEREKFGRLLEEDGLLDSYRTLYPDKADAYTWWSYRMRARERNVGWRIDYFLVSRALGDAVKSADIYADVMGSDHCPVGLTLEL